MVVRFLVLLVVALVAGCAWVDATEDAIVVIGVPVEVVAEVLPSDTGSEEKE